MDDSLDRRIFLPDCVWTLDRRESVCFIADEGVDKAGTFSCDAEGRISSCFSEGTFPITGLPWASACFAPAEGVMDLGNSWTTFSSIVDDVGNEAEC
jgi:hypothetical protein